MYVRGAKVSTNCSKCTHFYHFDAIDVLISLMYTELKNVRWIDQRGYISHCKKQVTTFTCIIIGRELNQVVDNVSNLHAAKFILVQLGLDCLRASGHWKRHKLKCSWDRIVWSEILMKRQLKLPVKDLP